MILARPIIFCEKYTSLEDFFTGARRWNLDFKKISPGKFHSELKLIDCGLIQLSEIKIKGKILQNGFAPENFTTIIIPGDEMQSFKWQYFDINSKLLLVMPRHNQFSAITNDSFHVFTISIHNDYIAKAAPELNLLSLIDKLNVEGQIYPINKNFLRLIISNINVIFYDLLSEEKSYTMQEELVNSINKLTKSTLGYINDHPARIPQVKFRKSDEAVLKFCEIYNASDIPDLSIDAFCRNNGIKQRTLEKAIKEYFLISPIAFLKALKLNLFHRELFSNYQSVSDTAKRCGFKHLGLLSADYKKLFGELPSDTVKRLRSMPYSVISTQLPSSSSTTLS